MPFLAAPPLRLGIVGAGGFATFVASVAGTIPDVAIVAVSDQDPGRAADLARSVGAAVARFPDLLDTVDAVIIGTPPASHAPLALEALGRGRHVFCEKPAAVTQAEAGALVRAVRSTGLTYVVDHVIRYNPLVGLLVALREGGVIGPVQRFTFDNDAGDSHLGPDHWFWDPTVSGGILFEHAVHFFDVAGMLIGAPALATNAMATSRPDGRVDTVVATVQHANGALATHAHGFSHPNHAERQLMRVDFGWAEARLDGWIPLSLTLQAWTDDVGLAALQAVADDPSRALALPGYRPLASQAATLTSRPALSPARSRDATRTAPHHATLRVTLGTPEEKHQVYAESVRAALTDFAESVRTGAAPSGGVDAGAMTVAVAASATLALASGRTERVTPAP